MNAGQPSQTVHAEVVEKILVNGSGHHAELLGRPTVTLADQMGQQEVRVAGGEQVVGRLSGLNEPSDASATWAQSWAFLPASEGMGGVMGPYKTGLSGCARALSETV